MSKPIPQNSELEKLIKKSIETYNSLTSEQKREQNRLQRISWVYRNLSLNNPNITREMVEKAVEDW